MNFYNGFNEIDTKMVNGGSFVNQNKFGYELFNFRNIDGKVYGYVQAKGNSITLEKIDPNITGDVINHVLVIFTANIAGKGSYIVGWYKNATVHRKVQNNFHPLRKHNDINVGYNLEADYKDAVLLKIDERNFTKLPRGNGGMGQSNVWYANSEVGIEYKRKIISEINSYESDKINKIHKRPPRQFDIEKRKKIEKIAIKICMEEYEKRNYNVNSVETENLGYDIHAKSNTIDNEVFIEVKGLSGTSVFVELTNNEYIKMNELKDKYRLAIVNNCLKDPYLRIFSYNSDSKFWIDEEDEILKISELEIVKAHCYLE